MINQWILNFKNPELEVNFNESYFHRELKVYQYSIILGVLTYMAFISLDYIMYSGATFQYFLINRLSIILAILCLLFLSYFFIKNYYQLQILAIVTTILPFLSHVAFTFIEGVDSFYFFTANSILIIFLFNMLSIRFLYLVFMAILFIIIHLFILYLNFDFSIKHFSHQGYGIVAVSFISLISSRVIEYQKRQDFLNKKLIEEQKESIQTYNRELKHSIEEKDGLVQALKIKNEELDAFNHSVSHDLKNPIHNIDSFSKLLQRKYNDTLNEEGQAYLQFIIDGTQKMNTLVEDMLNYSRIQHAELQTKNIDMNGLVENIFNEQARAWERKPILVKENLPPATADPILMSQVWANLISNAIKYSSKQPQSKISVGADKNLKEVTYWIKDNGVGFDMAFASKLFVIFSRLHSDKEYNGTGVGLSLVDRIIKKHQGKIWAESKPNQGSTFFFTLPLK